MLETLKIRNIAVIDSAEIPFKHGLNIISGETGAGKSIVIEAIGLILGGRASADLIRTGADEAVVEGLFDTASIPWIRDRLERFGFEHGSRQLLVKRMVSRSGKHRIYINGELATLAMLLEVCDGLVDLCGQHEHQSLLKAQTQVELLDRFGGNTAQAGEFAITLSHYRSLCKERDIVSGAESESALRADFLRFQAAEIKEASLAPGEDEQLLARKKLLQTAGARIGAADASRLALEGEDGGALDALRCAMQKARTLLQLDENTAPVQQALERSIAEAEEASIYLNRYLSAIDASPSELEGIQERLSLIADLKRKYGPEIRQILATLSGIERELGQMNNLGERLAGLEKQIAAVSADLKSRAVKLTSKRKKAAELFSKSVTAELKDLKMGDAELSVELEQKDDVALWTQYGADSVQFVARTNRGDVPRPLGKVASGGELSRLMLAIRRVIADRGGIGVYLFDEIDAGIGGQTAFQVGRKLKSVSEYNQVICITHLPQIAAFAANHLSVVKTVRGQKTFTEVCELSAADRKEEIARMLGGPELTKKSLENAAEMIGMAK